MPRARRRIRMATIPCFWRCCEPGRRYQGKEITNADFEQAVEEVLPTIAVVRESQVAGLVFRWLGERHSFPAARSVRSEVFPHGKGKHRQRCRSTRAPHRSTW